MYSKLSLVYMYSVGAAVNYDRYTICTWQCIYQYYNMQASYQCTHFGLHISAKIVIKEVFEFSDVSQSIHKDGF